MKLLFALIAVALLGVGSDGCGGGVRVGGSVSTEAPMTSNTSAVSSSAGSPTARHTKDANDQDHDALNFNDDGPQPPFGPRVSRADREAVVRTIKRYYGAAAVDDGATTCSMLVSGLEKAVPEDYGRAPGPPGLKGGTCSVVMSKLFKQHHRELIANVPTMVVMSVRVKGMVAQAILGFVARPERQIFLTRAGRAWKMEALYDSEIGEGSNVPAVKIGGSGRR